MGSYSVKSSAVFFFLVAALSGLSSSAQRSKSALPASPVPPQQAINLANQGHCRESISALERAMTAQVPAETRKLAGVVGIRCSLAIDDRSATLNFIRLLGRDFGRDPDVLYVIVHAYSDLSTRTALDLARSAPQSTAAHKLNAEALEMQGKWESAQREYEAIIQRDPNAHGIHFLLGRLLLSRPDAGPGAAESAKQEFLKEIQIDPSNAGAHYILGELARRDDKCEDAIEQFTEASKLDPSFAEAYLGEGLCLVTLKKYEDAIPPLRNAERLTPGNPEVHHTLATALQRSGHKEEAEKEFAIHSSLTSGQSSEGPQ